MASVTFDSAHQTVGNELILKFPCVKHWVKFSVYLTIVPFQSCHKEGKDTKAQGN